MRENDSKYWELGLLFCLFKSDEWEWDRERRCEIDRGRDGERERERKRERERVNLNYKKLTISSLSREKEWLGGRKIEKEGRERKASYRDSHI